MDYGEAESLRYDFADTLKEFCVSRVLNASQKQLLQRRLPNLARTILNTGKIPTEEEAQYNNSFLVEFSRVIAEWLGQNVEIPPELLDLQMLIFNNGATPSRFYNTNGKPTGSSQTSKNRRRINRRNRNDDDDNNNEDDGSGRYAENRYRKKGPSSYLLQNINAFGEAGGFENIMNRLQSLDSPWNSIGDIHRLVNVVHAAHYHFTASFGETFSMPFCECVLERSIVQRVSNDSSVLKDLNRGDLEDIIRDVLEVSVRSAENKLQARKRIELLRLDIALRLITCGLITWMVEGLNMLNNLVNMLTRSGKGWSDDHLLHYITADVMTDFIVKEDIISLIIGPDAHDQILKRAENICVYMARQRTFTRKHIDMLSYWFSNDQQTSFKIAADITLRLVGVLDMDDVVYLSHCMERQNLAETPTTYVSFLDMTSKFSLKALTQLHKAKGARSEKISEYDPLLLKDRPIPPPTSASAGAGAGAGGRGASRFSFANAAQGQAGQSKIDNSNDDYWFGIELLWRCAQDRDDTPAAMQEEALKQLKQLLRNHLFWPLRKEYMIRCFGNIQREVSVVFSLDLAQSIFASFAGVYTKKLGVRDNGGKGPRVDAEIVAVQENLGLLEICVDELSHYKLSIGQGK